MNEAVFSTRQKVSSYDTKFDELYELIRTKKEKDEATVNIILN